MLELYLPVYNFYLTYAKKLVADVTDERLVGQPVDGITMNHAAFLLGHLAWAKDNVVKMLGGESALPADWKDRFGAGSQPAGDRASYPSKAELLAALESAHARLAAAAASAPPEVLDRPAPERMLGRFPTMRHLVLGLMVGHYANHLGQLSAWRRAMGFPPVL